MYEETLDKKARPLLSLHGGDFNDRLFLGQLASLMDVPTQKIDFLKEEIERKTIERSLKKIVKEYVG